MKTLSFQYKKIRYYLVVLFILLFVLLGWVTVVSGQRRRTEGLDAAPPPDLFSQIAELFLSSVKINTNMHIEYDGSPTSSPAQVTPSATSVPISTTSSPTTLSLALVNTKALVNAMTVAPSVITVAPAATTARPTTQAPTTQAPTTQAPTTPLPTTPVPTKPWQFISGNNGTVSCNVYCQGYMGSPWNNELPKSWNGATCKSGGRDGDIPCNKYGVDPKTPGLLHCICEATGTGWYGGGGRFNQNI